MSSVRVFRKFVAPVWRPVAVRVAGVALVIASTSGPMAAGPVGTSGLLFSTFLTGGANSIAVDPTNNIYVAGSASTIPGAASVVKLDPTGSRVIYSTSLPSQLLNPSIALDSQGNAYVTGEEYSGSTGVTRTIGAGSATTWAPVIKIDPAGAILWHVRVGGSQRTMGWAIAVDGLGSAYVAGRTTSSDYPTTSGAFDRAYAGGTDPNYPYDAFVYKLSADATQLAYSTYLGGSGQDEAHGIAVDSAGYAFVAGYTGSANFPTTSGAFQTTAHDAFDLFVTKLNPQGSGLVYSTFLGSSGRDFISDHSALALDQAGDAFVLGMSNGTDYPTTANATQKVLSGSQYNYVVTGLNNGGNGLLFSTYLGGSSSHIATGIALGGASSLYVSGWTSSADFPTTVNAFQATLVGPASGTVSVLDPQTGTLVYSTYAGAKDPSGWTQAMVIASDARGDVYFGGSTPPEYPTTPGSVQPSSSSSGTGFLTKLVPATDVAFGRPAASSSNESSSLGPLNAVDGAYTTRWSSQFSDPQWIAVDLGSTFDLHRVALHWETAYGSAYQVETSNDASTWTTQASVTSGDGGLDDVAIAGTGRYLRIYGTQRATGWGYSLWEIEAYGVPVSGGTNAAPAVTLTSPANGTTMTAPATVTVSATASDSDGSIARVDLYQGSTTIASVTSPPYTTTVSNLPVGTYTFSAVATDNSGASTTSSTATVTVNASSSGSLPAPWQDTNLNSGYPIQPGSASYANGTFTINGTGYGAGGPDFGNYVYQPAGDTQIVARVTTVQNTSGQAGAGVMWRDTLDPWAAEVSLVVRPGGNVDMLARATSGSSYTQVVATVPAALPIWLKLVRTDPWFDAYVSADGAQWTAVSSIRVPMASGASVGLIGVSGSGTAASTSTFDHVAVGGGGTTGGLPSPWVGNDVGSIGLAGSASNNSGAFTVKGSGADIWGTADAFQYVSQSMGDGEIVARVTAVQNTSPYAKAGVMLRETMAANSAHVLLDVKPDGGIEFMTRSTVGGSTSFIAGGSGVFPAWLKLVRAGSTVQAYASTDGTTWSTIGTTTTSMAATTNVGLVVTSHDNTVLNTSTFDNVAVTPASSNPPPPPSNPNIVIYANDVTSLHGTWSKVSDGTAAAGVKLVTPDNGVANTTTALASPSDYVDMTFNAAADTPYRIWLRLQALNNSKYNDSVWIQFSDAAANGAAAYPIGTTNGLLVNLATDGTGNSVSGWGWQNTAYWLSQATTVTFATSGTHTLRIQVREDGVQVDQIVLSPTTNLNAAPGPPTNDATIVAK